MYRSTEQNDLRRRRAAWVLAVGLHLGLAAVFYLSASGKHSTTSADTVAQAQVSSPSAKAVNIP